MIEAIYKLGIARRNPSLWKYYDQLKQNEQKTLDELRYRQQEKLREVGKFADKYSKFYRVYFKESGIDPSSLTIDSLKQLPVLEKSTLVSFNSDIHSDFPFRKRFKCQTSGSTGQVLSFWRDEAWDSANRASLIRAYDWHNVKPWQFNIYFWGYNSDKRKRLKVRLLDYLQNRYRLFDYSEDTLKYLVNYLPRARYIHGYSSMIYEFARLINKETHQQVLPNLKMVKGTSETIFPHYSDETKKAFGKKLISEYGAAESCLLAYECLEGNMHLITDNAIVEELDGEIIVTNLRAFSFPIFRYKLGDAIKLKSEDFKCPCGISYPVLEEVQGRVGQSIFGKKRKFPTLTFYYIFKNIYYNLGFSVNYHARQLKKGEIELLIEEDKNEKLHQAILNEAKSYFKGDIDLLIFYNQKFHNLKEKKKAFQSYIKE